MAKVRAALIGTGMVAVNHIQALEYEAARAELVAVVNPHAQALHDFAEQHRIKQRYTDTAQMLAEQQPDLVIICTPPATHADLIRQALEAGAHVLCEKPIVSSLKELDDLLALEQRSGRILSSVFQWRFGSSGQHMRRLIQQDAFGRPLLAICHTLWYRGERYYAVPWRGKWQTELGGVSMGLGIHAMDFLLWLLGDWEEVSAILATLDREIEVEDVSMAHVRFQNGALGSIVNSVLSPHQTSYVRLDFQRATVELEHLYHYRNSHWRLSIPEGEDHRDELSHWASMDSDVEAHQTAQLTDLLNCLEQGARPTTGGASLRQTLEFVTSLYKSAFTRQPVQRGSIGPDDPFYYSMNGRMPDSNDVS